MNPDCSSLLGRIDGDKRSAAGARDRKSFQHPQAIGNRFNGGRVTCVTVKAASTTHSFTGLRNDMSRINGTIKLPRIFELRHQKTGEILKRKRIILAELRIGARAHLPLDCLVSIFELSSDIPAGADLTASRWLDVEHEPLTLLAIRYLAEAFSSSRSLGLRQLRKCAERGFNLPKKGIGLRG
jgi:hypothetical protein